MGGEKAASIAGAEAQGGAPAGAPVVDNNFNLLRLVFALMVAAYHLSLLPRVDAWKPAGPIMSLLAEIGVQGFFVLSGYLVYASLRRSRSLKLYAEKRVRRLYPAYATVVLACAVIGLAASPAAQHDLGAVARYLGVNLAFLNFLAPGLPGVFQNNPLTEINGALWTLKIEVLFYVLLPVLALLVRGKGWTRWAVLGAIYVGAEAWRYGFHQAAFHDAAFDDVAHQLPGQMSFFAVGIGFCMLDLNVRHLRYAGAIGAGLLLLSVVFPLAAPLRALGLGAVAIYVATGLPRIFDAARFGDLSYGLYIVHFPVIQVVVAVGLFAMPWAGAVIAMAGAFIAALLLWHLVEKPALRADSAYRKHT
ncbi:MAG TPA: acyltransferase [Hyphomonadaceae bacterium]|nr:acyltransferase [Hyphomonadaceae bacterium]